jgi:excisionase family DNA binding protein
MGDDGDAWVTVAEAAQLLGLSVRTVHRRAKDGAFAHRVDGRRLLIARSSLPDPVTRHDASPESAPAAAILEPLPVVRGDDAPPDALTRQLYEDVKQAIYRLGKLEERVDQEVQARQRAEDRAAAAEARADALQAQLAQFASRRVSDASPPAAPEQPRSDPSSELPLRRPWWRRLFGSG